MKSSTSEDSGPVDDGGRTAETFAGGGRDVPGPERHLTKATGTAERLRRRVYRCRYPAKLGQAQDSALPTGVGGLLTDGGRRSGKPFEETSLGLRGLPWVSLRTLERLYRLRRRLSDKRRDESSRSGIPSLKCCFSGLKRRSLSLRTLNQPSLGQRASGPVLPSHASHRKIAAIRCQKARKRSGQDPKRRSLTASRRKSISLCRNLTRQCSKDNPNRRKKRAYHRILQPSCGISPQARLTGHGECRTSSSFRNLPRESLGDRHAILSVPKSLCRNVKRYHCN